MSRQISSKALFVNCSDDTKQNLCNRWQLAKDCVASIHHLVEFDRRFETANFEYVLIDRQTCASASSEDLLTIQKLAGLSDCVIIADSETSKIRFASDHGPLEEFEALISLIDHECRNVLQRIQMRIELIKTNTSDQDSLLQNIQRVEKANDSLQQLMSTMSFLREPLQLDCEQNLLGELIRAGWNSIVLAEPPPVEPEFDLASQEYLRLDSVRIKMAIRDIFNFLVPLMAGQESLRVIDHSITIDGERFLRVAFQILPRPNVGRRNPLFQLAVCKKILQAHGGRLELDTTIQKNTVCAIALPLNGR